MRSAGGWCSLLVLLGGASCAPVALARAEPPRVRVRIEFVPPLAGPVELSFAHENGAAGTVRTGSTGVDLELPVGPVVLTVPGADRPRELVLRVAPGVGQVQWDLQPSTRDR